MKMMPTDVIFHENQLQHLSEPSIFMLDVFRTADHAGQIFIPHRLPARRLFPYPIGHMITLISINIHIIIINEIIYVQAMQMPSLTFVVVTGYVDKRNVSDKSKINPPPWILLTRWCA